MIVLSFLGGAMLLGLIPAAIASRKGGSFASWWLFGTVMWIVALPAAILTPSALRPCPWCAEPIRPEAIACRYCGRDVDPAEARREAVAAVERPPGWMVAWGAALCLVAVVVVALVWP